MNVSRRQFVDAICIGLRAAPDLPQDARSALARHARTAKSTAVARFFIGDCQCPISACRIEFPASDPHDPVTSAAWSFIDAFDTAMKLTTGMATTLAFTAQIED